MKIIISHDVDHLQWSEHLFRDLFIPKYLARHTLFLIRGEIEGRLYLRRLADILKGRLNRIEELIAFDKKFGIPATYFIGMDAALGMSYPKSSAERVIRHILSEGFEVGVHGVMYDNFDGIKREFENFKNIVGSDYSFGVRNHYLRRTSRTLRYQGRAGYLYDSTVDELKPPYQEENIWEIPLNLMDADFLPETAFEQNQAREVTFKRLSEAEKKGLPYFVINTHDIYFSELFPGMKEWYMWLVEYLSGTYEFTDFLSAVRELSGR